MQLIQVYQKKYGKIKSVKEVGKPIKNVVPRQGVHIIEKTGPMELFIGKKVIIIDDLENTTHSAKDIGFKFSYQKFGQMIRTFARSCAMHSFFTCENPKKDRRSTYLINRGWTPHPIKIEYHGRRRYSNADNTILCYAGHLIGRSNADVVGIISGDGALGNDIARFVSELPKNRNVLTISMAGSTSYRLNAINNRYITENVEIGLDCLRPFHGYQRTFN